MLKFNLDCISNADNKKGQDILRGCWSPALNALYSTYVPILFNMTVIMIALPALLERKLALKCPLSLRLILLYNGWRIFY